MARLWPGPHCHLEGRPRQPLVDNFGPNRFAQKTSHSHEALWLYWPYSKKEING